MKLKHVNFSGMGANCYLIDTDDVRIVVDPFDTHEEIDDFFTTDKPKYVLLTHFHFDHILGAKEIREKHGAKIAIGEADEIGLYNPEYSLSGMVGLTQEPFYADILFENGDVFINKNKFRVFDNFKISGIIFINSVNAKVFVFVKPVNKVLCKISKFSAVL